MLSWIKWKTTWIFALFVIISPFFMIISRSFLSFMLGFNVFLAFIPLAIIWLLKHLNQNDYKYKLVTMSLLFMTFILFFPNTFYIITDLIHLNSTAFYTFEHQYAPMEYLDDLPAYVMLMHILIAILFGIYAGVESLSQLRGLLESLNMKRLHIESMITLILVLSSIGIYIGRFMRFFSWDIIRPFDLLSDLFIRMNGFFIGFVLMFTLIQGLLDLAYRQLNNSAQ